MGRTSSFRSEGGRSGIDTYHPLCVLAKGRCTKCTNGQPVFSLGGA